MKRYDLFSTAFFSGSLGADTTIVEKAIEKFRKESTPLSPGDGGSNVAGWQSGGINISEKYFECEHLFQKISNKLVEITKINDKPIRFNSWVNINPKGSYNKPHSHLNTTIFLSGVYYLKVPEGSGDIKFYDPRGHWIRGMRDHKFFYNGITYLTYSPKVDELILFPSWLEHDVSENTGDGERISIAFNVSFDMDYNGDD